MKRENEGGASEKKVRKRKGKKKSEPLREMLKRDRYINKVTVLNESEVRRRRTKEEKN